MLRQPGIRFDVNGKDSRHIGRRSTEVHGSRHAGALWAAADAQPAKMLLIGVASRAVGPFLSQNGCQLKIGFVRYPREMRSAVDRGRAAGEDFSSFRLAGKFLFGRRQSLHLLSRQLGKLQIQSANRVGNNVGNDRSGYPFVIGGYHIPGRPSGAGGA